MPCAYKQLFGFDCPFCGAQRAVWLGWQGKPWEALKMFPAGGPLILTLCVVRYPKILTVMLWIDLAVLLGNWLLKLVGVY